MGLVWVVVAPGGYERSCSRRRPHNRRPAAAPAVLALGPTRARRGNLNPSPPAAATAAAAIGSLPAPSRHTRSGPTPAAAAMSRSAAERRAAAKGSAAGPRRGAAFRPSQSTTLPECPPPGGTAATQRASQSAKRPAATAATRDHPP